MDVNLVIYDSSTGEILRTVVCPSTMIDAQIATGEDFVSGVADDLVQYVDITQSPHVVADKTLITHVITGTTITGLPECTATVELETVAVNDGVLSINIDVSGVYEVVLRSPVYLDTQVSVVVP